MNDGTFSKIAILGQGYVGLPLSIAFSQVGLKVTGIDTDRAVIDGLRAGKSHISDVSPDKLQAAMSSGLTFTSDVRQLGLSDVVIVCVPTPLTDAGEPDFDPLSRAAASVTSFVDKGTLVVLESTSFPGTTEEFFLAELSKRLGNVGHDFFLAFSPERIDPGNKIFHVSNTPRVVGGVTQQCAVRTSALYSMLGISTYITSSPREAEMAKLLENTFRQVNIALVNELAKICHEVEIDVWEVIEAAGTKPFGFEKFKPGPGVGGHCIPIDPVYLSSFVKERIGQPFEMVELASRINDRMPEYVANRCLQALGGEPEAAGKTVLLLGITYKPNVADLRGSPAAAVARSLLKRGVTVTFHDPFISSWDIGEFCIPSETDLMGAVGKANLTVLVQNHSEYEVDFLATTARKFLDTRGVGSTQSSRL